MTPGPLPALNSSIMGRGRNRYRPTLTEMSESGCSHAETVRRFVGRPFPMRAPSPAEGWLGSGTGTCCVSGQPDPGRGRRRPESLASPDPEPRSRPPTGAGGSTSAPAASGCFAPGRSPTPQAWGLRARRPWLAGPRGSRTGRRRDHRSGHRASLLRHTGSLEGRGRKVGALWGDSLSGRQGDPVRVSRARRHSASSGRQPVDDTDLPGR